MENSTPCKSVHHGKQYHMKISTPWKTVHHGN